MKQAIQNVMDQNPVNSSVTVTVSIISKYDDYRIEIRHADTQQLIWRAWDFEQDFLTELQRELARHPQIK